jgi:hypothetical protein
MIPSDSVINELNRYTEAIEILRKYNPLRNDLDAYLYQICLWAEGALKPKLKDYGIECENTAADI